MDDPSFYGFPEFGEAGGKVTQDAGGKPVDPDTRGFEEDPDLTARVSGFVERYLPGAGAGAAAQDVPLRADPRSRFHHRSLTRASERQVAVGGGHGFKFASVIWPDSLANAL